MIEPNNNTFSCLVSSYQQFRPVTGDGWLEEELLFSRDHTAIVVMHATIPPLPGDFDGWNRAVPYLAKTGQILDQVFPPLLESVRAAGLPVFHVPGFAPPAPPVVSPDPCWAQLQSYRQDHVFPGAINQADVASGRKQRVIAESAQPQAGEITVESATGLHEQAFARGINHLIYVGFALNWCLLMSPGGMVEMKRYGYLCSTVRDAVLTVEPATDPDRDREMQSALWRVAVEFGFIFRSSELIRALSPSNSTSSPK